MIESRNSLFRNLEPYAIKLEKLYEVRVSTKSLVPSAIHHNVVANEMTCFVFGGRDMGACDIREFDSRD